MGNEGLPRLPLTDKEEQREERERGRNQQLLRLPLESREDRHRVLTIMCSLSVLTLIIF